jgi:hypothetical protein
MTFNFVRNIIEKVKIKKEAACPPKNALEVKRKKYIMDVLDQPTCFDFNASN